MWILCLLENLRLVLVIDHLKLILSLTLVPIEVVVYYISLCCV